MVNNVVTLDYGSGGRASHRLIKDLFLKKFSNPILDTLDDAAKISLPSPFAVSTDGYTVHPLFFPGGSIGSLAVNGSLNDVAMLGAVPRFLCCSFIIEEGLAFSELEEVVNDMALALKKADVSIITGDTKVVPKGAADKLFITTTAIGEIVTKKSPSGSLAKPGDKIILSGTVGDHGLTIMAKREELNLDSSIKSDCASLHHIISSLFKNGCSPNVLRDPTRGGLASTLNEIAEQSNCLCSIFESSIPISDGVLAGCSILGLDPLYLANEGKFICVISSEESSKALEIIQSFPEGQKAAIIGEIENSKDFNGKVVLNTTSGGKRLLGMLEGEQLPRIC